MNKVAHLLTLTLAATSLARGQTTVAADIQRGVQAYQNLNVEAARQIFTGIINSKQQVTNEQRVLAYQYLGGVWAVSGKPDSALAYFAAAVDNDPFLTELDSAGNFAADEQAAFARAKRSIFRVGIRPVQAFALDPKSPDARAHNYTFQLVATHNARLDVELVHLAPDSAREVISSMGSAEGLRDVQWNGLLNTQLADTGIYELRVTASDRVITTNPNLVERHKFRIDHVHVPYEDTLPDFKKVQDGGADTLTSRHSSMVPVLDGSKAAFLTAFAAGLPFIGLSQRPNMSSWSSHFYLGIGIGLVSGVSAVSFGLSHKDDRAAVAENARRKQVRAQFNAAVKARNDDRRSKTILIILPITGVGG